MKSKSKIKKIKSYPASQTLKFKIFPAYRAIIKKAFSAHALSLTF
jgi:hypothetical protein